MKIFIPSYGRAGIISTPFLLEDLEWNVVVHDESEAKSYKRLLPKGKIIVSGVELGIAKQRNWIINNLVGEDEWFCFMDDNIKTFWRVHPNFYNQEGIPTKFFNHAFWDKRYRHNTLPSVLLAILEETRDKAKMLGAKLAGFATTDNPFFRALKWRSKGFVCTKAALIQKTTLRFDERFFAKDDVDFSAQNLDRYGCVLVNNYLYPKAAHHQPGGIGNRDVRQHYSSVEALLLAQKWPELCAVRKKDSEEVYFKK